MQKFAPISNSFKNQLKGLDSLFTTFNVKEAPVHLRAWFKGVGVV